MYEEINHGIRLSIREGTRILFSGAGYELFQSAQRIAANIAAYGTTGINTNVSQVDYVYPNADSPMTIEPSSRGDHVRLLRYDDDSQSVGWTDITNSDTQVTYNNVYGMFYTPVGDTLDIMYADQNLDTTNYYNYVRATDGTVYDLCITLLEPFNY